jgi:hypothetical protein
VHFNLYKRDDYDYHDLSQDPDRAGANDFD